MKRAMAIDLGLLFGSAALTAVLIVLLHVLLQARPMRSSDRERMAERARGQP